MSYQGRMKFGNKTRNQRLRLLLESGGEAFGLTDPASHVSQTGGATSLNLTHEVTAGTDVLIFVVAVWGAQSPTIEDWVTTVEPFTEIYESAGTGAADVRLQIHAIANPTAKSETITVSGLSSLEFCHVAATNLVGVDVSGGLAAAYNIIDDDIYLNGTLSVVLAAGGASGSHMMAICGSTHGTQATWNLTQTYDSTSSEEWTEYLRKKSGNQTGNNDCDLAILYLADQAEATGVTFNNTASDESSGVLVEWIADGG